MSAPRRAAMNERIRGREAAQRTDAGGLRFVLWRGPGRAEIVAGVDENAVRSVLEPSS